MIRFKDLHHGVGDSFGVFLFGKLLKGEYAVFLGTVMNAKDLESRAGFGWVGEDDGGHGGFLADGVPYYLY